MPKPRKLAFDQAALVYQSGIANVFKITGSGSVLDGNNRGAVRLLQFDFRSCANFAQGLAAAGVRVRTYACNTAGDIAQQPWSDNLDDQPFSEKFIRVSNY